jgi:hypothetical protein
MLLKIRIGLSNKRFLSSVVFCILLLGSVPFLIGQAAGTASIQGTVTDATGALIAGATVGLINTDTQVKRTATTDSSGVYTFPNIPIGTYTVSITQTGFQTYTQSGIVLEVGSSISVNVSMSVGTATEHVDVKATSLALQTEDATFKQTIDQQTVTEMPLNGRQMTALITLSGGSTTAPGGDFTGSKYSYQTIAVSVAGGMGNTTMWRLDGGDNNDYMANGNLPFPFPDAVNQFSVEAAGLGAQDSMHTGGMVNVVTRSGTNVYHGSAFEFIRNNFIDATNFFSTSKDTLHQNQFGGTFGGPILRDKLFGFAAYQRTVSKQSQSATKAQVPTAANLAGDWSVSDGPGCTSNGKALTLVDPLTGTKLTNNKYATAPTYNPQALKLQGYFPAINPSYDTGNCGFVSYAIPSQNYDNQFVSRIDYTINQKNFLYGRYFIDGYQAPAFFSPSNILITTQSGNEQRVQTLTLGEAFTISSRTVNNAHITLMRRRNNRGYSSEAINADTLGVNLYQGEPNGLQLAATRFTIGGGTNSVAHFNDNTFAFANDLTLLRGKHQFVFGGSYVWNQLNIANSYEANGTFTFTGTFSGNGPNGGSATGDPELDFLQGALQAFQQSKQQQNALRGPIPSIYVQDTYHPTPRLTLVGGLRWAPDYMPHDFFNRGVEFNMADFLANKTSSVYTNAPAGALFYGDPGVSRQFTKSSPWQFSPNIGFSFDPTGNGKTVVRGGFVMGYDQTNFFTAQRNQQNPPFATAITQTQTSTSGPMSFSSPWSVGQITTNPFPQPQVPTPAIAQFFPQSQFIVMPTQFHPSYTEQWTASVQRDLGRSWQLQLQYIGSHTLHMPMGTPLGGYGAIYIPGVWGASATGCAGIVTTGPAAVKAGASGTPCSTTANQASRFYLTTQNPQQGNQYQGGGTGSTVVNDNAWANYNGLIVTVQHRLSSVFSFLSNYTWSKCLNVYDAQGDYSGTGPENPQNPAGDYGPCGSDYRNVANFVIVTRSQFHFDNRAARMIVNNWEFAPLIHVISGAPFNVTAAVDNSFTDIGNDRPNLIPGTSAYLHQKLRSGTGIANRGWLNTTNFAQVTAGCPTPLSPATCSGYGTYGNISRNQFRGPSNFQFDAQVSRVFPIYERLNATFRLEAFNVLNHPEFATPTTGYTSSTFGQISALTANTNARLFQGSVKLIF